MLSEMVLCIGEAQMQSVVSSCLSVWTQGMSTQRQDRDQAQMKKSKKREEKADGVGEGHQGRACWELAQCKCPGA